jgi:hydrogenase maturation protease
MITRENQILIACIGNLFFGDDGFGVEAAHALTAANLPSEAVVIDYGIRSFDLACALLEPWRAVILVDAIVRGGEPGSLYLLEPDSEPGAAPELDPHAISPAQVLTLTRSFGKVHVPIIIVGCEPHDFGEELEGRIGLSSAVAAAVPKCVAMVQHLIREISPAGASVELSSGMSIPGR